MVTAAPVPTSPVEGGVSVGSPAPPTASPTTTTSSTPSRFQRSTVRKRVAAGTKTASVMQLLPLLLMVCMGVLVFWQQRIARLVDPSLFTTAAANAQLSNFGGGGAMAQPGWNPANPLGIPQGQAQNLPSVRVKQNVERKYYGGAGDKAHLGGFTELDLQGISPRVWGNMITKLGVRSVLDVGCGRGVSTSWFFDHGIKILCVEGSHDAVERTILPHPATQIVEHDFSRGPWWPGPTFDAVWAVEFLEHVGINYHFNYVTAFRKAALLFVSSSRWGGWHHVEVHDDDWWIQKYEAYGFVYSATLTEMVRTWAREEQKAAIKAPNGKQYNAQHVWLTMKVFLNPVVAALPQHAHLLFEHGCFVSRGKDNRPCGSGESPEAAIESKLPPEYHPLQLTPDMDERWEKRIRKKVKLAET